MRKFYFQTPLNFGGITKGFKIFKDRHGKQRCYHRETGHKVDLTHAPIGSAEFFAECETIRAIAEAQRAKAPKAGTLGGLIQSYFETEHYQNLAEATRRDYRKCADFLEPIRDTPIHVIDTPLIAGHSRQGSEEDRLATGKHGADASE